MYPFIPALLLLIGDPLTVVDTITMSTKGLVAYCSIKPGMTVEETEKFTLVNGVTETVYGWGMNGHTYSNARHHYGIIDVNVVFYDGKVETVQIKQRRDRANEQEREGAFYKLMYRYSTTPVIIPYRREGPR